MISDSRKIITFSSRFIILGLIISFCLSTAGQTPAISNSSLDLSDSVISDVEKQKVFDGLWETVNQKYFDVRFGGVDWNRVREKYRPQAVAAKNKIELLRILRKTLDEINNPHLLVSLKLSAKEKELEKMFGQNIDFQKTEAVFSYGFAVNKIEDKWIVTDVESTSSADKKGVRRGWNFVSLNNNSFKGDYSLFGGEPSETAKFEFINENGQEIKTTLAQDLYLRPRRIIAERTSLILEGKILYLKFIAFNPGTGEWFKSQIRQNLQAPAVIIDLRGNTGGFFKTLQMTLESFFPNKTKIGEFIQRDGKDNILRVGGGEQFRGKVVVLIDENAASSAEIFTAALQESGRARIVGRKSVGAVLYSIEKNLPGGYKMRIAVRDYKTVKNIRLENTGVTPDVVVPLTMEDFKQYRDRILESALRILE